MSMFQLHEAAAWVNGRLVGDGAVAVERVHTDSRSLQPGDLFVALKGERFDANDFLADARAQGAVAAIAQPGRLPAGWSGIEVADSKLALGQLARAWRQRHTLPLVAVTGSNGKTTVTQMIAAILRAWQPGASLATEGNRNNDIGLPLTLLRLRAGHRVGVVELGMNHPGEIGYLAHIAMPTVALVNNAQREHQEFMASVAAVAQENASVFGALPADGCAVFPAGDAFTPLWTRLAGGRKCLTFGTAGADVALANATWAQGAWQVQASTPAGPLAFELRVAGRHNVLNALAAAAIGWQLGIEAETIAHALQAFQGVGRRFHRRGEIAIDHGSVLLVDDYGHHPRELAAVFAAARGGWPQRRLVVAFQPHRYTRTRDLLDDFANVLAEVDVLVLTDVYPAGEAPIAGADGRALARAVRARGKVDPVLVEHPRELKETLPALLRDGDLLLLLGAGDIGAAAVELAQLGNLRTSK